LIDLIHKRLYNNSQKLKNKGRKRAKRMIKIALCDDEQKILEEVSQYIDEYAEKKNLQNFEIFRFDSVKSLENVLEDEKAFDIFILDVYIGDEMGTSLAKDIRRRGRTERRSYTDYGSGDKLYRSGVDNEQHCGRKFRVFRFIKKICRANSVRRRRARNPQKIDG
jgi:response regulator RpfG family c-di-GMP phosphodiesterase